MQPLCGKDIMPPPLGARGGGGCRFSFPRPGARGYYMAPYRAQEGGVRPVFVFHGPRPEANLWRPSGSIKPRDRCFKLWVKVRVKTRGKGSGAFFVRLFVRKGNFYGNSPPLSTRIFKRFAENLPLGPSFRTNRLPGR